MARGFSVVLIFSLFFSCLVIAADGRGGFWEVFGVKDDDNNGVIQHGGDSHGGHLVKKTVNEQGELEVRVRLDDVFAMETVIPEEEANENALNIRFATNGQKLFKGIYNGNGLVDCDVITLEDDIEEFQDKFDEVVTSDEDKKITRSEVVRKYRNLVFFHEMVRQCKVAHRNQRYALRRERAQSRSRRAVNLDWVIYPGTKWCGRGNQSEHINDFGEHVQADRCCRSHDHCPGFISSWSRKFGYLNKSFSTISHCDCDDRFRSCLKNANSPAANMLGSIYFNTMKTKCFRVKHVEFCAKRSWWGKCETHSREMRAFIHEALQY